MATLEERSQALIRIVRAHKGLMNVRKALVETAKELHISPSSMNHALTYARHEGYVTTNSLTSTIRLGGGDHE